VGSQWSRDFLGSVISGDVGGVKDYRDGQKLSRLNAPVFTLSGYTEFLNLALDNRKSLGCG
jgi:hypothetical protein